jgi:hypothetical protein
MGCSWNEEMEFSIGPEEDGEMERQKVKGKRQRNEGWGEGGGEKANRELSMTD